MATLNDYKLILDQADMELNIASDVQNSCSENYAKAKRQYKEAAYRYIKEMNTFCSKEGIGARFDADNYFLNKYDR